MQSLKRCTSATFSTDLIFFFLCIIGFCWYFLFSKACYTNNSHYAPALNQTVSFNTKLVCCSSYPQQAEPHHGIFKLSEQCKDNSNISQTNEGAISLTGNPYHWSEAGSKCRENEWCWWRDREWKLWEKGDQWPPTKWPRGRGRGDVLPHPENCWRRASACSVLE